MTEEQIDELIYAPGEWQCKECGFHLTKKALFARTGQVGVDTKEEFEPCPNDGFVMERVTWKEIAIELGNRLEALVLERTPVH